LFLFRLIDKMAAKKREVKKKAVTNEIVTREYTINLHKRIHGVYVFHELEINCYLTIYHDFLILLFKVVSNAVDQEPSQK
jgi:hypothetical protein